MLHGMFQTRLSLQRSCGSTLAGLGKRVPTMVLLFGSLNISILHLPHVGSLFLWLLHTKTCAEPRHGLAGADCTLRGFDLHKGLQQTFCLQLPDFPYSLAGGSSSHGSSATAVCGCGNGSLVAVNAEQGALAWTLAGSAAAPRALHVGNNMLFSAGDDGAAASWHW